MNDDEQPAFPTDQYWEEKRYAQTPGMSLRDYFAGQAIAGMLAQWGSPTAAIPHNETCAEEAYKIADAMLRARDK